MNWTAVGGFTSLGVLLLTARQTYEMKKKNDKFQTTLQLLENKQNEYRSELDNIILDETDKGDGYKDIINKHIGVTQDIVDTIKLFSSNQMKLNSIFADHISRTYKQTKSMLKTLLFILICIGLLAIQQIIF